MTYAYSPIRPTITALLLMAAFKGVLAAEQSEPLVPQGPFKLKEAAYDFALNPDTGSLAAISKENGTAVLYLPEYFQGDESKAIGPVQIGEEPSSIIFKKHGSSTGFAIGCLSDPHIHLLDAATFKPTGKIVVGGGMSLLGTAEDDPYIYYIRPRGKETHDDHRKIEGMMNDPVAMQRFMRNMMIANMNVLGRVNVKTMDDEGIVCEDTADFAISPDGRYIYPRRHGSPTGIKCLEVGKKSAAGVDTKVIQDEHESSRPFMVDPRGQYVFVVGSEKAYSADLRQVIGTLKYVRPTEVTVFKTRLLVAGLNQSGSLVFYSYNTLKNLSHNAVPKEMQPDYKASVDRIYTTVAPRKHLHADDRNGRLILANNDRVMFYTLGGASATDGHPASSGGHPASNGGGPASNGGGPVVLRVNLQSPKEVVVDKPNTISLGISDARVTVELTTPVPGMSVVAGKLQWTPSQDQLGEHTIPLRLSGGGEVKDTVVELDVVRPHTIVPFLAGDCCVGPEGHVAAVWAGEIENLSGNSYVHYDPSEWKQHLAVVDLKENRVLGKTILPAQITAAAIDRHFVYVAVFKGESIEVRSREDLSLIKRISLAEPVSVRDLRSIGDKYLFALTEYGEVRLFSLPDLKVCDRLPGYSAPKERSPHDRPRPSPIVPLRDLGKWFYFDGHVYDKATGSLCLISSAPIENNHYIITLDENLEMPSRVELARNGISEASGEAHTKLSTAPLPWNRRLQLPKSHWNTQEEKSLLETSAGGLITEIEPSTLLLDTMPLIVMSRGTQSPYNEGRFPIVPPGEGDRPATSTEYRKRSVSRPTIDLEVCDLLSGKQLEKVRLFCRTIPYASDSELAHQMRAGGTTIVVLYQQMKEVHPHQVARIAMAKMAGSRSDKALEGTSPVYSYTLKIPSGENLVPPGFQPVQSAFSVSGAASTTLTHKMVGQVAGAQFELIDPIAGLSIDPKTSHVTVDGQELTKLVLSKIENGFLKPAAPTTRSSHRKPPGVSVEDYGRTVKPMFVELVGRASQGLPVLLPVKLRMIIDGEPVARHSYYVFLETPTAALDLASASQRLEDLEKDILNVHRQIGACEQKLADLRAKIDELQRDAQAVGSSPALELRLRVLRETHKKTTEQLRKAKLLLIERDP